MFGDEETTEDQKGQKERQNQQLALIRKEAKAIADTNEAIHAKVPAILDGTAQVRMYITGPEDPGPDASPAELLWYIESMMARVPAWSTGEAWECRRTYIDVQEQLRSEGREEIAIDRLHALKVRVFLAQATADPKAAQGGLTATSALITQDRRETLNQTIRQQPLAVNSPGIVEGLRNLVSGRRT
jgi:hypothetical protein